MVFIFLESIAPETKEANLREYASLAYKSKIENFQHKTMLLEFTFAYRTTFEYFGMNQNLFTKFVNSGKRFYKYFFNDLKLLTSQKNVKILVNYLKM